MLPGVTRFTINYIALESLLKKRADLKKIALEDLSIVRRPLDMRLKNSCLIMHIGKRSLT